MAAIIAIGQSKEKPSAPTLSVPVDALETDGVPPEKGDEIEHSIKGTVTAIKGDMATVKITAIDGSPVEGSPEEEAGESPEQESAEEGPSGASPNPRGAGNPLPAIPGLATNPQGPAGNPLAAVLRPQRARARAQTAALGAALRRRARGAPMPLM